MSASNETILRTALRNFRKQKLDELEKKLSKYADELLNQAVMFRFERTSGSPAAHNFTGNLVSSICVGLWREGNMVHCSIAGQKNQVAWVKRWHNKMTGPDRWYKFKYDYDTDKNTMYHATIVTDEGFGRYDAQKFLETHQPAARDTFHLAVAYTTEYAAWVEAKRHTTGYLETVDWIKMTINDKVA